MNIEYRLGSLEDLGEIICLVKNCIIEMESNNIFQWDKLYPTSEDFIEDINNNSLYIGLSENIIVVIFVLNQESDEQYKKGEWRYPDRKYYVIHRLCVDCNFQNKGIAKQTMQFIERKLKKLNIQAIRLDVFSQNPYAINLYTHMGYSKVGYADWRKGRFYLMEKYL